MSAPDAFQLSVAAAEVYEARFVPALFARWAPHVVDAGGIAAGTTVLDAACGTGVVAREVADRFPGRVRVVGVDLNEGMLAVARRLRPELEWVRADAGALPFPDASVDTVLCQAALMFVADPGPVLEEFARVLRPEGTAVVQVWASVDAQRGWAPFYEVVARHAGPAVTELAGTYWRLGDVDALTAHVRRAGLEVLDVETREESAAFASVEEFVATEVEGTPLEERITGDVYDAVVADARDALAPWSGDDGRLEVPIAGHIVRARRRHVASRGGDGSEPD